MKDIFGKALLDFQNNKHTADIITWTSISEEDVLPLTYLFRNFDNMPKLEQKALTLARGSVLDVGCGAGNHSLYLQNKNFKVKAIDISNGAIEVAKLRGITTAKCIDVLVENNTFDTILLLMNGTGIFKTLNETPLYLKHLKTLLNHGGQILIDSSDIKYMYEDEDGGFWIDSNSNYHGELDYFLSYKGEQEEPLKWLYLDFDILKENASKVGLNCDLIAKGKHHDYLAKLYL